MHEWNAEVYHEVSDPQFAWGLGVLDRLPLHGGERVLDLGCGTGRLTERLLARLPRGRVVGVDLSARMLTRARAHLEAQAKDRIQFVQADAGALPFLACADAVFSTATFHWVLDHPRLFASVHGALTSGGWLVAQCGGGPNVERLQRRATELMRDPLFAGHFETWHEPWEFADAVTTARRLGAAGFVDVDTSLEPSPVVLPDAATFRVFVANVICRSHLARLPDDALRDAFMDRLTALAGGDDPPYELDYCRLNMRALKR